MEQRPVIVREGGNGAAIFGIVAILVIVGIAMFVWQPWNTTSTHTTIINQPAGAGAGAGAGGAAGSAGSSGGASSSGGSSGSSGGSGSTGH